MELSISIDVTTDDEECENVSWVTQRQLITKVSEALISSILETTRTLPIEEAIEQEASVYVEDCPITVSVSVERED
jgi:hypothetical protein